MQDLCVKVDAAAVRRWFKGEIGTPLSWEPMCHPPVVHMGRVLLRTSAAASVGLCVPVSVLAACAGKEP
jgi:hypothetical protein